jgi:hypothetical protein
MEPNAGISVFGTASWGAIFAGVVIILVFQVLLSLLGIWVGFWKVDPSEGMPTLKKLTMTEGIWWIVSSLIAVYLGGWVAGRLAGTLSESAAMLHGVLAWAIATLITTLFLASSLGSLMSGALGMLIGGLRTTLRGAQGTASSAMAGMSGKMPSQDRMSMYWGQLRTQIEDILQESGKPELHPSALKESGKGTAQAVKKDLEHAVQHPSEARKDIEDAVHKLMDGVKSRSQAVDKSAVVNILMKRTDMSREKAEAVADQWLYSYRSNMTHAQEAVHDVSEKASVRAQEMADQTAHLIGTAAAWSFVMLLITMIAGALGGAAGAVA